MVQMMLFFPIWIYHQLPWILNDTVFLTILNVQFFNNPSNHFFKTILNDHHIALDWVRWQSIFHVGRSKEYQLQCERRGFLALHHFHRFRPLLLRHLRFLSSGQHHPHLSRWSSAVAWTDLSVAGEEEDHILGLGTSSVTAVTRRRIFSHDQLQPGFLSSVFGVWFTTDIATISHSSQIQVLKRIYL